MKQKSGKLTAKKTARFHIAVRLRRHVEGERLNVCRLSTALFGDFREGGEEGHSPRGFSNVPVIRMAFARNVRVRGEDQFRLYLADHAGNAPQQFVRIIERAVGQPQKAHVRNAERLCCGKAFFLPHFSQLIRRRPGRCIFQAEPSVRTD